MATTHTMPHGVFDLNNKHGERTKNELNWMDAEKRHLIIASDLVGFAIAIAMLVGAYFLLW